MKALVLADLHSFKATIIEVLYGMKEEIDMILLLGDVSESFFIILREAFPGIPIVAILGNHDYPLVFDRHEEIEHIHVRVVTVNGVRIAGIGGSLRYRDGDYPSLSHGESFVLSQQMEPADILISHTSPHGIHERDHDVHAGLFGIKIYLDRHKPKANLHGHQHRNLESDYKGVKVLGVYGVSILDLDTMGIVNVVEG